MASSDTLLGFREIERQLWGEFSFPFWLWLLLPSCQGKMDMGDGDKFEPTKGNEDAMSYHPSNMSSDWQFGCSNLTNRSMGLVPPFDPMTVCAGDPMLPCSSHSPAPAMDSFCPTIWNYPGNSQNSGFCDIRMGPLPVLDMGWTPPNPMMRGGTFLSTAPRMLPQSLSQFPADSGFIELAARFSCFGGGKFSAMVNPISIPEAMNPHARAAPEAFAGTGLHSGGLLKENEVIIAEASKEVSFSPEQGANERSPIRNEKKSESFMRSNDEAKQGFALSGNESDEAEFSGGSGGREEPSLPEGTAGDPSSNNSIKGPGSKKRKRSGQDMEFDQVKEALQPPIESVKDITEIQHKREQTPPSRVEKNGKQGSQASDTPKEEYIHVRARRGQATNSHSLAERVRREKISERMKFLQDLVPGCSKVTGKAVMLDEIINYVQSLQRQVEFLSMKLATVNPRLDCSIEGLLTKDILQSRAGTSSTLGYSPEVTMPFPPLHPYQPGLSQTVLPSIANSSDALRRSFNPQLTAIAGGYNKQPAPRVLNAWDNELHNVVRMGFSSDAALDNRNSSAPIECEDLNGSLPPGQMKVEL